MGCSSDIRQVLRLLSAARPRMANGLPATVALCCALLLWGCPDRDIVPLIGEGPEVAQLLGKAPADDPSASALDAARRLHQALAQRDTDETWSLLAAPTRRLLEERAATIGTTGRELLDASTLPGPGGTVRKVRYAVLLFGGDIAELATPSTALSEPDDRRTIMAVTRSGEVLELSFVREDGIWKLLRTELQ